MGDRVHKSLVKQLALPIDRQSPLTKRLAILKLFGLAAALMLSATASAVGLGGINVTSALGQTLKADIQLADIGKNDKDSLSVRLAAPDAYKDSGLEYPYGNKFKFEIKSRADGQPYINVSSEQPVNDPFVSLLVELTWSAGKLTREYTFLLDPPGYQPLQPAPAQVQAVAPAAPAPESAASAVTAEPAASAASPVVQESAASPEAAQVQPSSQEAVVQQEGQAEPTTMKPAQQAAVVEVDELPNKEWLEVKRGDTMYKIAQKYKLADMDLDRMLVALYRVNAKKFDGRNMNRIKAGKILRLPTEEEYSSVTQAEAKKEIHAQAADWNAYRQKLASAAPSENQTQATEQVATGKISSSVADMAPVAKESAKEVLKLSRGEAPGDQLVSGAGGKSVSGAGSNAAQEDAIAKEKTQQEEQSRAAMLEKNLNDMQRMDKLKVEAAALAQGPATAKTAVSEVAATNTVKAAAEKPAAKPAPAAKPVPIAKPAAKPAPVAKQTVRPEPSLLDQVLDEPLYLEAGGAVLLALAALGYMVFRRKKSSRQFADELPEDVGEITGRMASPVIPSPDTGDFTVQAIATQANEPPHSDIVDPISEADLFLNFGRDVQAEEILKDALQNAPGNPQILLKLLGIYSNRKDADTFTEYARKLQDTGDDAAWQQAVQMGRKLEPSNPMYGGGFRSMEDTGSATVQVPVFNPQAVTESAPRTQSSALDFDFDQGTPSGSSEDSLGQNIFGSGESTSVMSDEDRFATTMTEMDFDITSDKTLSPNATGASSSGMDFDITSTNPALPADGGQEESAARFDDLVFDTSGSSAFKPETAKPASKAPEPDDGGLAFTLDFPVEDAAEKPAPAPAAASSFADINLNFDDIAEPSGSATESKSDNWEDVSTKLDLAKAYQEMGDASGAREILEEVMREGDAEQRESAQAIFEQLG
ncbi:MAG: FimV/HubP family polar landmark protein [Gallionella sp.]